MIDSHVNIHHEAFGEDFDAMLDRARAAGIDGMLAISDRIDNIGAIEAAAGRARARDGLRVWRSVGAHPHYAKDHTDLSAAMLADLATAPDVIAIGETGLDLHYGHSPLADQEAVFRAHIAASRETGLPLIVHTREADALTADILEAETAIGPFPILLHCYTSGPDLLRRGLALGACVSFSGIASFRNAEAVRACARATPPDRMLIETDCPYLAPVPMRGRRNEPAFLPHVAAALAALSGEPPERLAERADANFFRLFGKAA